MVFCCYGLGCPNESSTGECIYHGNVIRCPIEIDEDEEEEDEYYQYED